MAFSKSSRASSWRPRPSAILAAERMCHIGLPVPLRLPKPRFLIIERGRLVPPAELDMRLGEIAGPDARHQRLRADLWPLRAPAA